ncbi:hypothetical protein [Pantoea anthophila]|uniref:hypothetical protein n=1 Tax=Pantoea anthophila TaxID=470931 RepID=UPI002DBEEB95|nr:hypothetical protein [Pantoea anthophila]MEB6225410.1 hypothetical protein [Pantoea anthophila]
MLTHRSSPSACAFSLRDAASRSSLCFLLLSVLLLCCSCFTGFLFQKVNDINSLMAPSGSPALPGRQPHCANRLRR